MAAEEVELLDVERQMEEELVDEFKQVERVIATRVDAVEGDQRYLVKVRVTLSHRKGFKGMPFIERPRSAMKKRKQCCPFTHAPSSDKRTGHKLLRVGSICQPCFLNQIEKTCVWSRS